MSRYLIYALISMSFAGLTSVIAKTGIKNVSGDAGLAIRTVTVFIIIWLNTILFQHTKDFKKFELHDIAFLILSGITTSLSWIFYYKSIKLGKVSTVALIDKGSILITLLLSYIILHEEITLKTLLGGLFVIIGLLILSIK